MRVALAAGQEPMVALGGRREHGRERRGKLLPVIKAVSHDTQR